MLINPAPRKFDAASRIPSNQTLGNRPVKTSGENIETVPNRDGDNPSSVISATQAVTAWRLTLPTGTSRKVGSTRERRMLEYPALVVSVRRTRPASQASDHSPKVTDPADGSIHSARSILTTCSRSHRSASTLRWKLLLCSRPSGPLYPARQGEGRSGRLRIHPAMTLRVPGHLPPAKAPMSSMRTGAWSRQGVGGQGG